MSNLIKYRVHEVAKDFKLSSKKVSDIMAKYLTPPKNHMQVLTDEELNVIFDEITQSHQIENIELVFSQTYKEPSAPPPVLPAVPEAVSAADTPAPAAVSGPAVPAPAAASAAAAPTPAPAPEQPKKHEPRVRIIDTRGATVDLGRYDERIEQLVPERAQNMKRGKEKIKRAPDKKSGVPFSQKRRRRSRNACAASSLRR
jgi:translation initiation factor IF-2